jgi:hypothetical protein
MKREIHRRYPREGEAVFVAQLLDCGVAGAEQRNQPGRCCVTGCQVPEALATNSDKEAAEWRTSLLSPLPFAGEGTHGADRC